MPDQPVYRVTIGSHEATGPRIETLIDSITDRQDWHLEVGPYELETHGRLAAPGDCLFGSVVYQGGTRLPILIERIGVSDDDDRHDWNLTVAHLDAIDDADRHARAWNPNSDNAALNRAAYLADAYGEDVGGRYARAYRSAIRAAQREYSDLYQPGSPR